MREGSFVEQSGQGLSGARVRGREEGGRDINHKNLCLM